MTWRGSASLLFLLLLSVILGTLVLPVASVNPCESSDGSGGILVNLNFTESYGSGDHLPTLGEERSLSAIFGTVRETGDPTGAQTVTLRIFDSNPNKFFNGTSFSAVGDYFQLSVRSGTGFISLKQGIDREIMDIYLPGVPGSTGTGQTIDFGIECRPDTGSFSARNFTARVSINDVNDNSPVFYNVSTNAIQTVYAGTIRENTPPALVVQFQGVQARDTDDSNNANVVVSVLNDTNFQTKQSGFDVRLYTNRPLDYESMDGPSPTVSVLVVAKDRPINASMAQTSTATIVFTVLDDDDLPPKFIVPGCTLYLSACLNPTYTANVVSNVTTSTPLTIHPGPILAVDQDTLNFSIRYSIVAGNFSSNFAIDEITGQVTQLAPIDGQVAAKTSLVIRASQYTNRTDVININLYSTALLTISVENSLVDRTAAAGTGAECPTQTTATNNNSNHYGGNLLIRSPVLLVPYLFLLVVSYAYF